MLISVINFSRVVILAIPLLSNDTIQRLNISTYIHILLVQHAHKTHQQLLRASEMMNALVLLFLGVCMLFHEGDRLYIPTRICLVYCIKYF